MKTKFSNKLSRPWKISLFLCINLLLLIVVFVQTNLISRNQKMDGIVINMAGRQRMLTQKMVKGAFCYLIDEQEYKEGELKSPLRTIKKESEDAALWFEQTLEALINGGRIPLDNGEFTRAIPAVSDPSASMELQKIKSIWKPFYKNLLYILNTDNFDKPEFWNAKDYVRENNLKLLNGMNKGVELLEIKANKHVIKMKIFQLASFIIGGIFFIGALYLLKISVQNTTERKQMEFQLRHAQKLEAIGRLAAGIAHEINTPTQYVGDNARFLKNSFEDIERVLEKYAQLLAAAKQETLNQELITETEIAVEDADLEYLIEEIPKAIQQSLEGVKRVAEIVGAMKEFSHPGKEEKVPVDLNRAIQSTITVSRNEWKYVAEISTNLDSLLPLVPCVAGDFSQVILNLIVNAAHAIADVLGEGSESKGKICIYTRQVGREVEIRVSDTGMGIADSAKNRIFDPFFTTKEVGKGTGQGLAICRSVIVKKHGGTITFETEKGKGTVFIVRLPKEAKESY